MTESLAQKNTRCSHKMERRLWLMQNKAERQSWIAQNQFLGNIRLTGNECRKGSENKPYLEYECLICKQLYWAKYSDLKRDAKRGANRMCKACVSREKMHRSVKTTGWKEHQRIMTENAAKATRTKTDIKRSAMVNEYDRKMYTQVYKIMNSAKNRCENPNAEFYYNYGGRGITFGFNSPKDATVYVLNMLGPKPSKDHSIDRIDNEKGYEPGNLRWADKKQQNLNKREYKRTDKGKRIRHLQKICDYSYESIRMFINQGLSNEQIITKRKYRTSI